MTTQSTIRILKLPEVMRMTALSRSAIYGKADPKSHLYDPDFPRLIKLTAKSSGWVESEVNEWLLKRIEQRNQQHNQRKAA